jgi:phenylalanyl-tRNA synthetase beta subunit
MESETQKNRQEFRDILEKFSITQAQAADLITKETNQNVSARKVRTWLANPVIQSARGCPNWAVTALKKALINLQNTERTGTE